MTRLSPTNRLFEYIREYESDTFSAKGSELSDGEVLKIVDAMLEHLVDEAILGTTSGVAIDGGMLTVMLENVRPDEADCDRCYNLLPHTQKRLPVINLCESCKLIVKEENANS